MCGEDYLEALLSGYKLNASQKASTFFNWVTIASHAPTPADLEHACSPSEDYRHQWPTGVSASTAPQCGRFPGTDLRKLSKSEQGANSSNRSSRKYLGPMVCELTSDACRHGIIEHVPSAPQICPFEASLRRACGVQMVPRWHRPENLGEVMSIIRSWTYDLAAGSSMICM